MGLEYLKARKNELNMTTEELSEKSGVPIGTLNKILAKYNIMILKLPSTVKREVK